MNLSQTVSLFAWIALIVTMFAYAMGWDAKTPYVPVAMVVLLVIGLIGGIAQSISRRSP